MVTIVLRDDDHNKDIIKRRGDVVVCIRRRHGQEPRVQLKRLGLCAVVEGVADDHYACELSPRSFETLTEEMADERTDDCSQILYTQKNAKRPTLLSRLAGALSRPKKTAVIPAPDERDEFFKNLGNRNEIKRMMSDSTTMQEQFPAAFAAKLEHDDGDGVLLLEIASELLAKFPRARAAFDAKAARAIVDCISKHGSKAKLPPERPTTSDVTPPPGISSSCEDDSKATHHHQLLPSLRLAGLSITPRRRIHTVGPRGASCKHRLVASPPRHDIVGRRNSGQRAVVRALSRSDDVAADGPTERAPPSSARPVAPSAPQQDAPPDPSSVVVVDDDDDANLETSVRFIEGHGTSRTSVAVRRPGAAPREIPSAWLDLAWQHLGTVLPSERRKVDTIDLGTDDDEGARRKIELGCRVIEAGLNDSVAPLAIRFACVACARAESSRWCKRLLDAAALALHPDAPISAVSDAIMRACGELARSDDTAPRRAAERAAHVRTFSDAVERQQTRADGYRETVVVKIAAELLGDIAECVVIERESVAIHARAVALLLQLFDAPLATSVEVGTAAAVVDAIVHHKKNDDDDDKIAKLIGQYVEWCLEIDEVDDKVTAIALQRQSLRALHGWLSLTRSALRSTPAAGRLLSALVRATLGGRHKGIGAPIVFLAASLDAEREDDNNDLVEEALWPTTLALLTTASDFAHLAPTLVPLHVEALRDALETAQETSLCERRAQRATLHLRSLLALAAHADPADVVDAFRYCEAVPFLLKLLKPPSRPRKQQQQQHHHFDLGDDVLGYTSANNDKWRWFPAVVAAVNVDGSFDVEFSSGSRETVPPDHVRRRRSLDQRAKQPLEPPRVSTTTSYYEEESSGEAWCVEIPSSYAPSANESRSSSVRPRIGRIDVRATTARVSDGGGGVAAMGESLSCLAIASSPRAMDADDDDDDDAPSTIALGDDEIHELCVTLLLCLSVGRASAGGELEPCFCATFPFTPVGRARRSARSPVEDSSRGRPTLTARSLSARSALLSARSDETAQLLDVGNGGTLGFHVLDSLHRHFNYGDRERRCRAARVVPRVLHRLDAWGSRLRAAGTKRLLRLVCDDAAPDPAVLEACLQAATVVGRGRFGTVVALDDRRAAKLVPRERSDKDRSVAHDLYREITALERLSPSSATAALVDYGVRRDCYVLVLERCAGGTLAEWRHGRPATPTDADARGYMSVFARVARCVARIAQANIVHLDLTCDNVLLRSDPLENACDAAVCVGDFGEARILGNGAMSQGASLLRAHGTECIQPPEVIRGARHQLAAPVGPPADVWALGCLLYELFCGTKLFEAMAATDWPRFFVTLVTSADPLPPPDLPIPERARNVVAAALQRDPTKRPLAVDLARMSDNSLSLR
ncbi:hypothetical protein CTAYLR_007065 [Chrysophaeum taylorii]|uniref:non-specific serine/threonine protein kinase n=1 Tax=Chrysophaeum taylorii TaxID=2483200 RepID=A0AAD7UM62_9STRA|nr:hypothetical protein CTAYLR_007065 [Chrysophaeum taylorii]